MAFARMFKPLVSDYEHQTWGPELRGYLFMLVALVAVPMLVTYIIYWVGKLNHVQMARTFGNDNQVVVGGLGNLIHEVEICVLARIGGHTLKNTHLQSLKDILHFKAVPTVSHVWVSHNLYESLFDFFIGALPAYLSGALLMGIQYLLGGRPYHLTAYPGGLFGWKQALGIFKSSLVTAFTTRNFLFSVLFFVIVLLIASTAFAISWAEIREMLSGALIWAILLFIVWIGLIMGFVLPKITIALWAVISFSMVLAAHVLIYLIIMFVITSFFHLIDKMTGVA